MNPAWRQAHETIRRWFDRALTVVDPCESVERALRLDGDRLKVDGAECVLADDGRLVVLAIGKAAPAMARGAARVLGDRIHSGFILTKHGHLSETVSGFAAFQAGHPVPDPAGLEATRQILEAVEGLSERDVVLALISGGGSALLELPREGVSLDLMQDITRQLMHAGAGIHDLNTVRKALSQVKGGGLRRRIGRARCVSLLLSDVLGNDPSVIASGPTVLSSSTREDAWGVLENYGVADSVDGAVRSVLQRVVPQADALDTSGDIVSIIADNGIFIREVARLAREDGYAVELDERPWEDDAGELGKWIVGTTRECDADTDVIVRGGEATVTVTGDGTGGRNTEMALVAALELSEVDDWVVASLASDGDDGNSGAAGAIADPGTAERARVAGVSPENALRRNDSATVFHAAGGLVVTGATGTNVNDVYIALRTQSGTGR